MTHLKHIPGTIPIESRSRHPRSMGVGVIGLHEGRTLLAALNRCSMAHAVAGCDLNQEKIDGCRAEMPELFYTREYAAMLARDDVRIVAIYTPDSVHGEHIIAAFDAGKDVVCTKPLVNSIDDAKRVLAAGRRTGRKLLVGQSTRFFEPFLRQRAAFERGEIGEIELADAHYIHRMDWFYAKSPWAATDTDWVFLGLSHPIDLLRWHLGPIKQVQAFASRSDLGSRHHLRGNDIYVVNVVSESGKIGRAMGHYGVHELPSARNCIELMLYGTRGSSLAQYHDMRYVHTAANGDEVTEDHLYAGRHYYFNSEVHGMHYGEFANYAEHLADAIIHNRPHAPNLEEGIETFCIMEAVRRSADSGAPVNVAPLMKSVGL